MLALLPYAPVPAAPFVGGLPVSELCRRLTETTGERHLPGELRDYSIFVSVRSGAPERIEALAADALGARWIPKDGGVELQPVRPVADEAILDGGISGEFADFERLLRSREQGPRFLETVAPAELFALPPGRTLRLGARDVALRTKRPPVPDARVLARRTGYGSFQVLAFLPVEGAKGEAGEMERTFGHYRLEGLPPGIVAALGDAAKRMPLSPEEAHAARTGVGDPGSLGVDPLRLDRKDPLSAMADLVLTKSAKALPDDLVVALTDGAFDGIVRHATETGTLAGILGSLSPRVVWRRTDGALVGALPAVERRDPTQARREPISALVASERRYGVPPVAAVATYLARQRSRAGDVGNDGALLRRLRSDWSAIASDHFPYDLRWAASLGADDRALLRAGRPFFASRLGPKARTTLRSLLSDSSAGLYGQRVDPAGWSSLAPERIVLIPSFEERDVLVEWAGPNPAITTPRIAWTAYTKTRTQWGAEPLYQAGRRRTIDVRIAPTREDGSIDAGSSTAFQIDELAMEPDETPKPWSQMPTDVRRAAGID